MEELIGKKFKWNKYGPTIWTGEVKTISCRWELIAPVDTKRDIAKGFDEYKKSIAKWGFIARPFVNGKYALEECIMFS